MSIVDPSGLRASGQGMMFGVPVTINMGDPTGKPAEASIGLTLDDADRAPGKVLVPFRE